MRLLGKGKDKEAIDNVEKPSELLIKRSTEIDIWRNREDSISLSWWKRSKDNRGGEASRIGPPQCQRHGKER